MSPFKSFEEVYQSSYSHGLEQIYKLENVDVKSIRKIEPKNQFSQVKIEERFVEDLDLGNGHRLWITPSVFEEPIEVLELHKQPEKILKDQGILKLKTLYETDLSSFIYSKGMGQGHIDEIRSKLNAYLYGKPTKRQYHIDFPSWIITLLAPLSRKESLLLMEAYQLEHSLVLTPMDVMDVRKMSQEQKRAVVREAIEKVRLDKHKALKRFQEIESAFIKPWVLGRMGIASSEEIEERIKRKSNEPDLKRWNFISDLMPEIKFGDLYFASPQIEADYLILEKAILSFFWNEGAIYPFTELFKLVSENLSLSFRSVEEAKFLKYLEISPLFSLVKEDSTLLVSIA